ncbi:HPP family protein [Desulforudis sp. 1088]|uniref:CBS domain-containing protein n=1 Tax=unclassified Candidatus Desulforudis TaxID=2635950 RepID=UPI003CE56296
MTREKLVRELQVPIDECLTLPEDIAVTDAIAIIGQSAQASLSCHPILILNNRREPVGILSIGDLTALGAAYTKGNVIDFAEASRRSRNKRLLKGQKVAQVMRPIRLMTVQGSATLGEAVHKMVRGNLSFLPVLESEKITGVISFSEVLQEAARIMAEAEVEEAGYGQEGKQTVATTV